MSVDEMVIKWSMDSKQFNDGLTTMNRNMNVLKSGFNATNTRLQAFGSTTDQLKNKQKYLTEAMSLQKQKVDTLKEAYDKQVQATGENSKEAENLAIKLNNQINYYNKLESQLSQVNQELETHTNKWKIVSAKLEETGKKLQTFGDKMSSIGAKMTLGVTVPLIGIGVAATNAASDLEQTQRRTEIIFGEMTQQVRDWASENERTFGLGAGTIEKYTSDIGDLTQGLGMSKDASLDMSQSCVELGVIFGNWNSTNPSAAMGDLQSAIMGNNQAVEKYGVKLNETVLNEYTRKQGLGDTFNKLSEVEKAQVRYAAIIGSSQNAIQFWNDGNRSSAFYLTEVKEQLGNTAESLGAVLLPQVLELTKSLGDFVAKLSQWMAENPKLVENIVKIGGAVAVIGPVVSIFGKLTSAVGKSLEFVANIDKKFAKLKETCTGVVKNLKTVGTAMLNGAKAAGQLALSIGKSAVEFGKQAIQAGLSAVKLVAQKVATVATTIATNAMSIAQAALNFVMNLNPIVLIITALAGLVAGIVIAYNKCEWFRDGVNAVWEKIKSGFEWACDGIKNAFTAVKNFVVGIAQGICNTVIKAINWVIRQLNSLSFTVPDWIPIWGGETWGVNLQEIREVNWLYKGGIIDSPTILPNGNGVGDAYKGMGRQAEAVIPLDAMYRNVRNIVREESNTQPINVNVIVSNNMDSTQIAKAVTTKVTKEIGRSTNNYRKGKGGLAYG